MHTYLRDLVLLAAVTAVGGAGLARIAGSRSRGESPPAPLIRPHSDGYRHYVPISFSGLGEDEHLRVRLASRGCSHDFEHEFVFTRATGGAARLSHSFGRDDGAAMRQGAPSHLSATALAELDALIARFRAPVLVPRGRLARPHESVELSLYRHGVAVAMERFAGTCGSPGGDALSFGRLLRIERWIAVPADNWPLHAPSAMFGSDRD